MGSAESKLTYYGFVFAPAYAKYRFRLNEIGWIQIKINMSGLLKKSIEIFIGSVIEF